MWLLLAQQRKAINQPGPCSDRVSAYGFCHMQFSGNEQAKSLLFLSNFICQKFESLVYKCLWLLDHWTPFETQILSQLRKSCCIQLKTQDPLSTPDIYGRRGTSLLTHARDVIQGTVGREELPKGQSQGKESKRQGISIWNRVKFINELTNYQRNQNFCPRRFQRFDRHMILSISHCFFPTSNLHRVHRKE